MTQNPSEPSRTTEAARLATIDLLGQLRAKSAEFGLPEPPPSLPFYLDKLAANHYQVLVAGEAKRGKSSFVNALIGRDILPTDVDIATCQVFRIQAAEREAYRLRFEDESCRDIGLEDLPRYGSQVEVDLHGTSEAGTPVRWIEVDVPIRFLPKEVSLLDTPGMGALYAAHAQITYRYVPRADAVIFVLDSEKPIVQDELDFIGTLLDVTHHLFFIQTKIDRYGEQWEHTRQRNAQILKERYGATLGDIPIWPVSSLLLRKAGQAGATPVGDAYLMAARHKELAVALQTFLFRAAGWARLAEAVAVAEGYHGQGRQCLAGRSLALGEESKQKRAELQQGLARRKQAFEEEWGEKGQKRREVLDRTQDVINIAKQNFRQALQPGGSLESAQRDRIQGLRSFPDMEAYQRRLGTELAATASRLWQETSHNATLKCFELLSPLLETQFAIGDEGERLELPVAGGGQENVNAKKNWFNKLQQGYRSGAVATTLAGSATYVAVGLASATLAPWVLAGGVVCTAAAGLWGWMNGTKQARLQEQEKARQQLMQELGSALAKVRQYFFDVDLSSVRYSRFDEFYKNLEHALQEQLQAALRQKSTEAQAELAQLAEQAQFDDRQRQEKATELKARIGEWNALGQELQGIQKQLEAIAGGS